MASYRDNSEFCSFLISNELLDQAIEWIADRLSPEEVFDEEVLFAWCRENARSAYEVCPDWALHEWAESADYIRESEACL